MSSSPYDHHFSHLILLHSDLPIAIYSYFSTNSYYMEVAESLVGIVGFVGSETVVGGYTVERVDI